MSKVQSKGLSEYIQFYARNNHLITMGILRFYSYASRDGRIVTLVILTQKVIFLCFIFSCTTFATLKQISADLILKIWAVHIH
jgi:hypothetical protein